MKLASLLLCVLALSLRAAENYHATAHPVIGDVTLGDGRLLHQVQILSAGLSSVNLKCDRGLLTISRALLPAEISQANPFVPPPPPAPPPRHPAPMEITLQDGRTFRQATITNVTWDGSQIIFQHEAGRNEQIPVALAPEPWKPYVDWLSERAEARRIETAKKDREFEIRSTRWSAEMNAEAQRSVNMILLVSFIPDSEGGRLLVRNNCMATFPLAVNELSYRLSSGKVIKDATGLFSEKDLADLHISGGPQKQGEHERSFHLTFPAGERVVAIGCEAVPASWIKLQAERK